MDNAFDIFSSGISCYGEWGILVGFKTFFFTLPLASVIFFSILTMWIKDYEVK
jgi:hypothetical protein